MNEWEENLKKRPILRKKERVRRRFFILLYSLVIIGGTMGWMWFLMWNAKKWVATPCVIVSIEQRSNLFSKLTKVSKGWENKSYSWHVVYRYEYEKEVRECDRYTIFSRDYRGDMDAPTSTGTVTECYVNPNDPSKAVLWHEYDLLELAIYWPMVVSEVYFVWCFLAFLKALFSRTYGVM